MHTCVLHVQTPAVRPDEHRSVLSGGQRTSCGFEPSVLSVPLEGGGCNGLLLASLFVHQKRDFLYWIA